ncbi:hypothetical protein halTADL_3297 [Halohasta litchfieldiae]|jgi:hypothetical protein|uniref:Archaeal Type IV pilin N-terminal domain-containing protein n=1 Tax=Halohasta litchfieldiae TaxID=1073996 RepID=A0A1H6WDF8_9EURY|nr:type IV pilin N-terminal domain-containing protein [Halohasta litchfieldiae]ATW89999.1 hypothetical protein halTADL_3297 [Halohasta litchfieldiae]SEJ13726.1 hypothetical protein SAMN05444271_12410 [Halohasta litchfieldiae]
MMDRGQSESVGVILLTAVIALTVTSTGAVVLSDWQADIEQGPIADLDSEFTPINMLLEHRGGNTLNPNTTTIRLVAADEATIRPVDAEAVTFDEPFQPGTSLSQEFDLVDGTVELLVVHDPTNSVVYSETHRINARVERLLFEIANRTDPAYVLEGTPATYTVDKDFEAGVDLNVTDEANITVEDESKLDFDEPETTITGLDPDPTETTNVTAEVDGYTAATEVIVLESDPPLEVATKSVNITDATSLNADGKLVDLGGLPEVDLFFRYLPSRIFNGDSLNNSDGLVADGEFHTDPDGYAHDNDWVHDNTPLEPGENRSYIYDKRESGADFQFVFRDDKQTIPTADAPEYVHLSERFDPPDATFRVEVSRSTDGSTADVVVYDEPEGGDIVDDERDISVGSYTDLYYSSFEVSGTFGDDSLRLTAVENRDELSQVKTADSATDTNTTYEQYITGIQPNREYALEIYAEQSIGGQQISSTGNQITFNITGPTVETVDSVTRTGARSAEVKSNIKMGDFQQTDLFFEYVPSRIFNGYPTNNNDGLVADGGFYTDPDGYAHDNNWVHDNTLLEPGENRTYVYDKRDSGADFEVILRTDEQRPTGSSSISNNVHTSKRFDPPEGEFRVEVNRSNDSSTLDLVVYNEPEGGEIIDEERGISVESYDEIYYSTIEVLGSNGEDSLRLIGVENRDGYGQTAGTTVTESGSYTDEITGLQYQEAYSVTALTKNDDTDPAVTATGDPITFRTSPPVVETVDTTRTGNTSADVEAELVEMGGLQLVDLYVRYLPSRIFNGNATNNSDGLVADGGFYSDPDGYAHDNFWVHDNTPLKANKTRSYVYDTRESGADFEVVFRDDEQSSPTDSSRLPNNVYTSKRFDPPAGQFRVEVSRSTNSSTADIVVYDEPKGGDIVDTEREIPVGGYPELYYSTIEVLGADGDDSLRLIAVENRDELAQVRADTSSTTNPTMYTGTLSGLDQGRDYGVTAVIENGDIDSPINASGEQIGLRLPD